MPLNKQKGNMYPWVTHTWNVIKGKCPHDCVYCYMKGYPQPDLHFDEKELSTTLGHGNCIFVGSSCDMWAACIDDIWLHSIVQHCLSSANIYLFQTKNPARFLSYPFPSHSFFYGVTIESNRHYLDISKAPSPLHRYQAMLQIKRPKMISIEPILDFDLDVLLAWIDAISPQFVSIGADSKGHGLPEPPAHKVIDLIAALSKFTEVKLKDNLKRITK